MPDAALDDIMEFLKCRRLAIVGVSRQPRDFSRALFREFVARGYDAVPVNPHAEEVEGRRCFPRIGDVTPLVPAALLMTPPATAEQNVRECVEAEVKRIWVYKAVSNNAMRERALDFCRKRGLVMIDGYCPFMFFPKPGFVHRVHRFFMQLAGSYPL
jgi:predicted CoA-binding protein